MKREERKKETEERIYPDNIKSVKETDFFNMKKAWENYTSILVKIKACQDWKKYNTEYKKMAQIYLTTVKTQ